MSKPLAAELNNRLADATSLCHQLYFLVSDLEQGLSVTRAIEYKNGIVTLMFNDEHIYSTIWLVAEALITARKLRKDLTTLLESQAV